MRSKKYWALGAAVAIVLSACSNTADELPTPIVETPSAVETDGEGNGEGGEGTNGAGQSQRADQVLENISDALDTAYGEMSIDNIRDRIGGPARLSLVAMFKNAERFDTEATNTISAFDPDSTWGTSTDFPRVAMAFTEDPDTGTNDQLLVLAQSDGRENYRLWGFADLVPADVDITFTSDTDSVVKEDGEGLVASPLATVEAYAELLQDAETDLSFEEDGLTTTLHERRDSIAESLGDNGESDLAARALDHGPLTLTTEDGGAVTMGVFEYDVIIERTAAGSTITVADKPGQWMTGEADSTYDVKGTLTSTYLVTVAFYIPPEGGGNIQVIAASSPELVDVTDDDSTDPD